MKGKTKGSVSKKNIEKLKEYLRLNGIDIKSSCKKLK